jgi:hypothetical protein
MCQPAPVKPTGATLRMVANCVGHVGRRGSRCRSGENETATDVLYLRRMPPCLPFDTPFPPSVRRVRQESRSTGNPKSRYPRLAIPQSSGKRNLTDMQEVRCRCAAAVRRLRVL